MNDAQRQFLSLLAQPPARFTTEQAAWALNCQVHDIPVLIAAWRLKPRGSPQPNGTKYSCAAEIRELAQDRAGLARMSNAIYDDWRCGNRRRHNDARTAPSQPHKLARFERPTAVVGKNVIG
jgi:hypothetical protein